MKTLLGGKAAFCLYLLLNLLLGKRISESEAEKQGTGPDLYLFCGETHLHGKVQQLGRSSEPAAAAAAVVCLPRCSCKCSRMSGTRRAADTTQTRHRCLSPRLWGGRTSLFVLTSDLCSASLLQPRPDSHLSKHALLLTHTPTLSRLRIVCLLRSASHM